MSRVPTWTELRLDAAKLVNLQKECHRSINQLLDRSLPELDRKILSLNVNNIVQFDDYVDSIDLNIPQKIQPEPIAKEVKKQASPVHQVSHVTSSAKQDAPTIPKSVSYNIPLSVDHAVQTTFRDDNRNYTPTNQHDSGVYDAIDLQELEHLRPLPLPLSEYLKQNRPEFYNDATRRSMTIEMLGEKRRKRAEARAKMTNLLDGRVINAFGQIRLSSRGDSTYPRRRQMPRNLVAPDYNVKVRMSEREMKRLTAKTYDKLPEVKLQRQEEVKKLLKVQNYKNRLQYGRKLLKNRRNGLINYPLKVYDDDTINNTQLDFVSNGSEESADSSLVDPCY